MDHGVFLETSPLLLPPFVDGVGYQRVLKARDGTVKITRTEELKELGSLWSTLGLDTLKGCL